MYHKGITPTQVCLTMLSRTRSQGSVSPDDSCVIPRRASILKRRATMRFDTTSELVEDPLSAERVLWEGRR